MRILVATTNPGKLRDFTAAAARHGVEIVSLPEFAATPEAIEDGRTFEENARKKAEHFSRHAPGQVVIADDSGLEVDALGGAPGVQSARYAAMEHPEHIPDANTDDSENNARLLREMDVVPDGKRTARFVCVIAAARDGQTLETFRGSVEGILLREPRGHSGFGYDPLFFHPPLGKTLAELTAEEKSAVSHRGKAFVQFLQWCEAPRDL